MSPTGNNLTGHSRHSVATAPKTLLKPGGDQGNGNEKEVGGCMCDGARMNHGGLYTASTTCATTTLRLFAGQKITNISGVVQQNNVAFM